MSAMPPALAFHDLNRKNPILPPKREAGKYVWDAKQTHTICL